MTDTVAVVIPAYNAARHVTRAIESVLAQTTPVHEVIVVDDGSSDNTAEVVAAFPPPVRVIRKPNGGPGSARNVGARDTTATWLAFLDADDWWFPQKIEAQLAVGSDPAVGLVHCLPDHRDEAVPAFLSFEHLWERNWIINSSVLLRRQVFMDLGGFDEARELISVEDYNLWLRVAAAGWRIAACQQVLVHYTRGIGLSSHTAKFLNAQMQNIQRLGAQMGMSAATIHEKQARLLLDFGRRAVFERDLPAARRLFARSFSMRPTLRAGAHLLTSLAPRQAFEVRRRLVTRFSDRPDTAPRQDAGTTNASIIRGAHAIEHLAAHLPRPVVITTIDAEEDFNWDSPFSREATDVTSMRSQHIAHRIFERYGVRPTYMVDYPVAAQDAGRAPLRELLGSGVCDVGTQLHPWVTPPFHEAVSFYNSYPGNLAPQLEYDKIAALTEEIDRAFGVTPRIFRAGRYGVGPNTGGILARLGYQADSSVVPCWSFENEGGPDYRLMNAEPFWIDRDRTLLELPVAAAMVGAAAGLPASVTSRVFRPSSERARLPSVMARLGLLERIKLTPEGIELDEAKRLVRHMVAGGHRVFVLTYHSPSLEPGNTPYVRNQGDLERFLAWLDGFYDFFRSEIGGAPATWSEVRGAILAPRD